MIKNKHISGKSGFTIVELLIVIIVIAILATIGFVQYTGMQDRAREAVLRSDLTSAAEILNIDQVRTGSYPEEMSEADRGNGLPASVDTEYQYTPNNSAEPPTFCLTGINGMVALYITQDGVVNEGTCEGDHGPIAGGGDPGGGGSEVCGSELADIGLAVRDFRHETVITSSEHTSRSPVSTDVTMPDIKNGDLVLIHVSWDSGGVITDARFVAPEGFQKLDEYMGNDSFMNSVVWWAIADCIPSTLAVNIRHGVGVQNKISVISVDGVQPSQPVVAVDGFSDFNGYGGITTALPTPSTTPTSSSGIDIRIGYTRFGSNVTWTPPAGYTEIVDFVSVLGEGYLQQLSSTTIAYKIITTSSPTGVRNFTTSGNEPKQWTGYTITAAAE